MRWWGRASSVVAGGQVGGGGGQLLAEFGRTDDFSGRTPAENPTFDFEERTEAEMEVDGAVGAAGEFLGLVPVAFGDALGD